MLLFIISQEPLYKAIENNSQIKPFKLPNYDIKLQGYADDTNFILSDDVSIKEAFRIVNMFELATAASLNLNKTEVFGIGLWKGRAIWPITNVNIQVENMSVLGIKYSNNFDKAVDLCWSDVNDRIANKVQLFHNRKLTLYQRAVIVNGLLTSLIWYQAQTYPLPLRWSKKINVHLFKFIWRSKVEPIARSTLNLDKTKGGLSVFNIFLKSECLFACRMIKQFLESEDQSSLVVYYNAFRVNPLVNINSLPINVSFTGTPYYETGITTIRKMLKINCFPNISSKIAYNHILSNSAPKIEERYPLHNWECIWNNIQFKYVPVNTREILFKYIHEILPNKHRLKQIRRSTDDLCESCNRPETNIHMVHYCKNIEVPKRFLENMLTHCCVGEYNLLKLFFLDISKREKKKSNTILLLITLYISSVWYGRANKVQIVNIYVSTILNHLRVLKSLLGNSLYKMFTSEFCNLSQELMSRYQ